MSEVDVCTQKLKEAILNSEEYKEYIRTYEILTQYPGLLRQTNEFRRENFELQHSADDTDMFDKIQDFRRRYEQFRTDSIVDDFLQAELCFARMIQSITKEMLEDISFDISYLDN